MSSAPVVTTNECAHHWLLMAPSRNFTVGTCKLCGVTREFSDQYQAPGNHSRNAKPKASPPPAG